MRRKTGGLSSTALIIVTPATLITLAKAVAFRWRQEKVAENAHAFIPLAASSIALNTITAHIERSSDALGKSIKHFNQLVGSLENSMMPQVRRFNEFEGIG